MEEFPKPDFWQRFIFDKLYDSLAYFISPYGKKYLRKRYNEYNYHPPKQENIKLGEKVGRDKKVSKKNKTLKDFLNE